MNLNHISLTMAFVACATNCVVPARADSGCGDNAAPLALEQLTLQKNAALNHLWGKENITFLKREPEVSGDVLRVAYPKDSFSPGNSAVRGGAGFELPFLPPNTRKACLSYKVRFPAGFDFVKGGKLPGLFGGDNPRGCVDPDAADGFSTRLMWRAGGAGELYLYAPGRDMRCGKSIGRGSWTFSINRWTAITQKIVMNAAGAADGSVEVWINGKLAMKASGLTLRVSSDVSINGLFFSTFFGGSDESWASPRHQVADFADFVISKGD